MERESGKSRRLVFIQVNFREASYDSEFAKEDIVFLTADSPNVLKGRLTVYADVPLYSATPSSLS